jgi:hypothetical protein
MHSRSTPGLRSKLLCDLFILINHDGHIADRGAVIDLGGADADWPLSLNSNCRTSGAEKFELPLAGEALLSFPWWSNSVITKYSKHTLDPSQFAEGAVGPYCRAGLTPAVPAFERLGRG